MKFKDNLPIIIILGLFLLLNILLINSSEIWWDSAVYIGMGKYIFSYGQAGLWEPIRPLTLPTVLGFFWKIGLNPLIAGEIFILAISISVIFLTYTVSKKLFDKNTAIAASILISFSTLMLKAGSQLLVETLAVFFLLLGFCFYLNKKNFFSGISFGLAFLTKFPATLFLAIIFATDTLFIFIEKEKFSGFFKKYLYMGLGFLIITIPYFVFNYINYNDILLPLKSANYVINNVVDCTVLHKQPFYYYFPILIKDNFLYLFFIAGFLTILLKKNKLNRLSQLQISFYVIAFLVYFSNLSCKTERYPILALPFIAMISGYGIMETIRRINKKYLKIGLIIIFFISLSLALNYTFMTLTNRSNNYNNDFYSYLANKKINGEVLTTTPYLAISTDAKLNIIYYPIYNSSRIDYYADYANKNKKQISYVFIYTNDMTCHPKDLECPKKTIQFISLLKINFKTEYYKKIGDSEYFIFSQ